MASTDYISDVSLQQNIEEIEIEAIPVDIPCETVETTINYEGEPMHIQIPRFTDARPRRWEKRRSVFLFVCYHQKYVTHYSIDECAFVF